jgi:hypothetical protein
MHLGLVMAVRKRVGVDVVAGFVDWEFERRNKPNVHASFLHVLGGSTSG